MYAHHFVALGVQSENFSTSINIIAAVDHRIDGNNDGSLHAELSLQLRTK